MKCASWLCRLILICFLMSLGAATTHASTPSDAHDMVIARLNFGVVLKHVDTVDVATDSWLQTFVVGLPVTRNITVIDENVRCIIWAGTDETLVRKCQTIIMLVSYMHTATNKALRHIKNIVQSIHDLVFHFSTTRTSDSGSRVPR